MLKVDVTIIGSGFAGSILAWVLASRGLSVVLVDRAKHPRFAIGESSTPIADSILRQLAEDYQIPVLHELSCWGSWQESHPDLPCGRKRGFSYLLHEKGKAFGEDAVGQKSLLVAASPTDFQSDTHWHRASFDTFLWRNAIQAGARDLTGYEVSGIDLRSRTHRIIHCQRLSQINDEVDAVSIASDWVVDASGSSSVFSQLLRVEDWTDQLKTKTHSTFAHYRGVKSWEEVISEPQRPDFKNPFSADDAAQHHLLTYGWMWMLRFNHGVTSVGYTTAMQNDLPSMESLRSDYPTVGAMMSDATCVDPSQGIVRTSRLQRWLDPFPHHCCLMLPTASLTLDPLHSTGIAHALAGVQRSADLILRGDYSQGARKRYTSVLCEETRLLDQLVHMAYRNLGRFESFTAACMVYFAAAIRCEETYQAGEAPTHLWNASDLDFRELVNWLDSVVDTADRSVFSELRKRLKPWNSAGLLDPDVNNRYAYTATK